MPINRSSLTICLLVLLAGVSGTALTIAGLFLYISPKLPAVEMLREFKFETPLRVYSADNKLIGEIGEKRSIPIQFAETPPLLIKAFLAAEDSRFYSHSGVDIRGTLRAISQFLQPTNDVQTGGSTITQQVAKLFFLTPEKTVIRKLNEWFLAVKIEKELEKNEILELYINKIYFGNRAYGIRAAAQVYYGKPVEQLTLAEFATLAGTPQLPSIANPIINPERALRRRDWILARMQELEFIDAPTYADATAQPNTAEYHSTALDLNAPYVTELARQHAVEHFGLNAYTDGYRVYTTVDSRLQAAAQSAVVSGLLEYDWRHGYRGAEQHLTPVFYEPDNESARVEETQAPERLYKIAVALDPQTESRNQALDLLPKESDTHKQLNLDPWLDELDAIPAYAGLQPAIVLEAVEQTVKVLLENGEVVSIPWENGPATARPYITINSLGARPEDASFLELGDVIRVRQAEGEWHLSQIPSAQSALVAIDPHDGAVRAMVGGFDFNHSHYNRAVQAERQPGSNFKPFLYTAALENGFTAASIVNDSPWTVFDKTLEGTWRPQNSDGKYLGPIRLREALYRSRNLASVRILVSLGGATVVQSMDRFGFDSSRLPRNDISLALGTYALKPIQVATAYAVFANGGYKVDNYLISRVEQRNGEVVFEAAPATVCRDCDKAEPITPEADAQGVALEADPDGEDLAALEAQLADQFNALFEGEGAGDVAAGNADKIAADKVERPRAPRVLNPQVAFIMDSILRDVVARGTGTGARRELGRGDLAGKTGTTNEGTDAWFSGYTPDLVASTWVGFDQNTSLGAREYGSSVALPIWIDFMRTALKGVPEYNRELPEGLVSIRINPKTGKRAAANNPNATDEWFRPENVPEMDQESDTYEAITGEEEAHPDELF